MLERLNKWDVYVNSNGYWSLVYDKDSHGLRVLNTNGSIYSINLDYMVNSKVKNADFKDREFIIKECKRTNLDFRQKHRIEKIKLLHYHHFKTKIIKRKLLLL